MLPFLTPLAMVLHLASSRWFELEEESEHWEMSFQFTARCPYYPEAMYWEISSFDDAHSGTCALDPAIWGEDPVDMVIAHTWAWLVDWPDKGSMFAAQDAMGKDFG